MTISPRRRDLLRNASFLPAWGMLAPVLLHAPSLLAQTTPPQGALENEPFDWERLKARARELSAAPPVPLPLTCSSSGK